jgi:hypothetical protein
MRRMWSILVLSATLAGPISAAPVFAAPAADGGAAVVIRVYDPYHHDYHRWDRAEQARYREYLRERHRSYVAYEHQRAEQRRAYWRWRHEHDEHYR